MGNFLKVTIISWAVFFISWVVVFNLGVNDLAIQSEDTIPAIFLPVSIIQDQTLYLDRFYTLMRSRYPHPDDKSFEKGLVPFYLRSVEFCCKTERYSPGGFGLPTFQIDNIPYFKYVSAFPIMSAVLAVPIYYFPLKIGLAPNFENLTILSHLSASLIVAASGGFFYLLLDRGIKLNRKQTLVLTVIYLFATINFALVSQALWQHGTVQLFTILALYFYYLSQDSKAKKAWVFKQSKLKVKQNKLVSTINLRKSTSYLFFSGIFIGFAIISRPTSGLILPAISLLVFKKEVLYFFKLFQTKTGSKLNSKKTFKKQKKAQKVKKHQKTKKVQK